MPEWQGTTFKKGLSGLSNAVRGVSARRKAFVGFAKKHHLIYFQTVRDTEEVPVIRGTTVSKDQKDTNYCIGSHADYDMALVERTSSIGYEGYKTTVHRWYVLQIDLRQARNLPFVFLGTKQQTKAYYARILTSHREVGYLTLSTASKHAAAFHGSYALLASPSELPKLYDLFTDDIIDAIATHKHPFAIEIDGDSVSFITEAAKSSEQLLDQLLHYGLWMAKAIDSKLS